MVSSERVLQEFIYFIPICQKDVSLVGLLSAISKSKSGRVAIVDRIEDGKLRPVGIVDSHCLLSYLTKNILPFRIDPGEEVDGEMNSLLLDVKFSVDRVITKIDCLSSQMSRENFLVFYREQNKLNGENKNYLAIDPDGKILGLLDVERVVKSYLLESPENLVRSRESSMEDLILLLEKISLPLMLENNKGRVVYKNNHWLKTVDGNRIVSSGHKQINDSLGREWRKIKQSWETKVAVSSLNNIERDCLCLSSNFEFTKNNTLVSPISEKDRYNKQERKKQDENSLETKKNLIKSHNWHYTKLPLNVGEYSSEFSLILATQLSLENDLISEMSVEDMESVRLKKERDKFIIGISHDLKTPVTAIVGLSSLLREKKLGYLNEKQLKYTDLIYRSSTKLMRIINDLLDINRLARGKLTLNLERIKIESTCREVYQQVLKKLKEQENISIDSWHKLKNKFKLTIEPDCQTIVADRLRLSQMLTRLLENALNLTTIEEEIGIDVNCWGNWYAITVWDRGRGRSEKEQKSLLVESFETKNFLNNREEGKELGLNLAQQLARLHKGDISFISQLGWGSEFTILLPLRLEYFSSLYRNPKSDLNNVANNYFKKHSLKENLVLIGETSCCHIKSLTQKIKKLGYCPVIARSSNEIVCKARYLKPKIILLNPKLVSCEKFDIIDAIKSDCLTSNIPIFLLSTNLAENTTAFSSDIDGLLPFSIENNSLDKILPNIDSQVSLNIKKLTILRLCIQDKKANPIDNNWDLNLGFDNSNISHHVIEADSIEQAIILARIWQIDTIIWDGINLNRPMKYLQELARVELLAKIPIVTLDLATTKAANQFKNLSIFPCLLAIDKYNIDGLIEVIQIAASR